MKQFIVVCLVYFAVTSLSAQQKTSGGERTSVDLTIYNQNLSLIREERTFNLSKGISNVVVPDIPSTIDGTSVHFVSLTDASAVKVLEQNYQFDLVNQGKLMEKYLGKQIEFIRLDEATKKEYSVIGKLLASGYATNYGNVSYAEE